MLVGGGGFGGFDQQFIEANNTYISIIMDNSLLYLNTPSASIIEPPINTSLQNLPIEKLAWEDFEKLCLRIARLEHNIDDCEIYGIKGQKQDGIDIFAQKQNNKYSCYQCKRYQTITEKTLETAVKAFSAEWKDKSDKFYFCTTASLNLTQLQKKFNQLKRDLKKEQIELIKWDKAQIESILKDQPKIVYDFFGKEWVKLFNGADELNDIIVKRKLDGNEIIKFRKELGDLYAIVFNIYDPGIPVQELNGELFSIQDRFIVPDVFEETDNISGNTPRPDSEDTGEAREDNHQSRDMSYYQIGEYWQDGFPDYTIHSHLANTSSRKDKNPINDFQNIVTQKRTNIDVILPSGRKIMVIGDPGYGKSTLLRYIILDLLSDKPMLTNLSRTWGQFLPIWLPFAFITKNLEDNPNLNISELLNLWFKSLDKAYIFEFVKDALIDERLLLIIDGVDEWTSINAARQAISKIEIHADSFNSIIIYSSRPYGYKVLSDSFPKVQEFKLCSFSETQQKGFIFNWYKRWTTTIKKADDNYAQNETNAFVAELKKSSDLSYLAASPLLLSILITQRMRDSFLPKNKLKALETISEYLINRHPSKRQSNASIIDNKTALEFDIYEVFTELAFYIQGHSNDGVILKSEANKVIESYLVRSMHYEAPKARKSSADLLNIGANHIGIIIEKSNDEVAFIHRQFQEYLAAKYLSELDQVLVENTLQTYADLPGWHQVITNFFGLIPSRSALIFKAYLDCLQSVDTDVEKARYIDFLKYEIALHLNNVPIDVSKTYLHQLFSEFDLEAPRTAKHSLLRLILDASENPKIKQEVKSYLFQYFPNHYKYDDYRLGYLRQLPIGNLSKIQVEFLFFSIINGNNNQRYSASKTLMKLIKNEQVISGLTRIIDIYSNPEIVSYTLNSMISDDVPVDIRQSLLKKFGNSEHPQIKFFGIKLKVNLQKHTAKDMDVFLELQRGISHNLKQEVIDILIDGWPNSNKLLKKCIVAVDRGSYHLRDIDDEIAWKVLFHSFNHRKEVVDLIIQEIQTQDFPFIGVHDHQGWPYLANYFRDNKDLIPVVDQWLDKQKIQDPQLSFASLIGRTEKSKLSLLAKLPKDGLPHWSVMALVDGWKNDPLVISELKKYFTGPNKNKFYAAQYISTVFADEPSVGVGILEEIAFNRDLWFRDRAIQPLIVLDSSYFKENLLEKFITNELPLLPKSDFGQFYNALYPIVEHYHELPLVKDYVFKKLKRETEALDLLIKFYPDHSSEIDELLQVSKPLSIDFRLMIVQKLSERNILDAEILLQLAKYDEEQEEVIKSTAAMIYFGSLLNTEPDKILSICSSNIFYRGHDYEVQRQIAFCGYLMTNNLKSYFAARETDSEKEASPNFLFETYRAKMGEPMANLLVEKFEDVVLEIEGDFKRIVKFNQADSEPIWSFFAKHSDRSSPTYKYISNYISENENTIKDQNLINFLNRTAPHSMMFKRILLRLVNTNIEIHSLIAGQILGNNFNHDKEVFNDLINIDDYYSKPGKIVALCIGWADSPQLRQIFDQLLDKNYNINNSVAYYLRFRFRDTENIMTFFENVFKDYINARFQHSYFIMPLIERIAKDEDLQVAIKKKLLATNLTTAQVSFFSILNSINKIDNEISSWKISQLASSNQENYGYNILKNEVMPLSDVLYQATYF